MIKRKWEKDVIPLCKELGIGFQAFSPMGNGFLSGKYNANDKFEKNDLRTVITRFKKENINEKGPYRTGFYSRHERIHGQSD